MARVCAIVTSMTPKLEPWPERKQVLVYCPPKRERLYRWLDVLKLIRFNPDFHFVCLGREEEELWPNQENRPLISDPAEYREVLCQSRCLLRLTEHDGMSIMVQEALALGRNVVWTADWSYIYGPEDLHEAMKTNYDDVNQIEHIEWFIRHNTQELGKCIEEAAKCT